jgi:hypothetical protein
MLIKNGHEKEIMNVVKFNNLMGMADSAQHESTVLKDK